jgi:hypothetical protein
VTKSLKTNPAYKIQAARAVAAAAPLIARGEFAAAARLVTAWETGPTACKLRTMRYSPLSVALRALGLRFVGSFPVWGGNNATYIAGYARIYAHKSGWEGRV